MDNKLSQPKIQALSPGSSSPTIALFVAVEPPALRCSQRYFGASENHCLTLAVPRAEKGTETHLCTQTSAYKAFAGRFSFRSNPAPKTFSRSCLTFPPLLADEYVLFQMWSIFLAQLLAATNGTGFVAAIASLVVGLLIALMLVIISYALLQACRANFDQARRPWKKVNSDNDVTHILPIVNY